MNQIITQASIEDNIEIKSEKQKSPQKLKHFKRKSKISIDDPEKIVSTKVPSVVRVAPISIPKETQNQPIVSTRVFTSRTKKMKSYMKLVIHSLGQLKDTYQISK